ncbi:MAG TPA: HD domain-containing protein [Desulfurobacteriaceae bacterium]|nr:HD domain-containing protein [Desulfurobacteriaceae bacterium]
MILGNLNINISKFLLAISSMSSLMDCDIAHHNYRVAYISYLIAREISFSNEFLHNIIISGLLHDIGLLLFHHKEDLNLVKNSTREDIKRIHFHAELGYELLRNIPNLTKAAQIIRYHHYTYPEIIKMKAPFSSIIIHLADRLDVFLSSKIDFREPYYKNYGNYWKLLEISRKFLIKSKKHFSEKLINILLNKILNKEAFWYEYLNEEALKDSLTFILSNFERKVPFEIFENMSQTLAYIIDFKSPFTATHSSGVAQTAATLASLMNFTTPDLQKIKIAGLLHDIGKVAIPLEILEKPGRLSTEEIGVMKSHVFFTYKILSTINIDRSIVSWASYHHEHLDGNGYPFKLDAKHLCLGCRIMAVADIFTALMEDRPYKKQLSYKEALEIIDKMVSANKLDAKVVNTLKNNLRKIDYERKKAQKEARIMYDRLRNIEQKFFERKQVKSFN